MSVGEVIVVIVAIFGLVTCSVAPVIGKLRGYEACIVHHSPKECKEP